MPMTDEEISRVNNLYTQLDAMTLKYNAALEDIHKMTHKLTDYADALVKKCECSCCNPETKK